MSIDIIELDFCIMEAERFLAAAKTARHEHKMEEKRDEKHQEWGLGKYNGAVRRASMDLTRALARLRKY